jgi:hypothetical protein
MALALTVIFPICFGGVGRIQGRIRIGVISWSFTVILIPMGDCRNSICCVFVLFGGNLHSRAHFLASPDCLHVLFLCFCSKFGSVGQQTNLNLDCRSNFLIFSVLVPDLLCIPMFRLSLTIQNPLPLSSHYSHLSRCTCCLFVMPPSFSLVALSCCLSCHACCSLA